MSIRKNRMNAGEFHLVRRRQFSIRTQIGSSVKDRCIFCLEFETRVTILVTAPVKET